MRIFGVNLREESFLSLMEDLFTAYYLCRKNKRNKEECLAFDLDYEVHLLKLGVELMNGTYKVDPLTVFIVEKPVKREIFTASFRDRIIHHFIVMKLEPLLEKEFIYDTYSCRKGKGTHFGINRLDRFLRRASNNYQKDCYVLKLDIKGYFMSINKIILINKLEQFLQNNYKEADLEQLLWLCRIVILSDATCNCTRVSPIIKWEGLPQSKSLFYASPNCGLPIGNYTNQVFANFYLNQFDHYLKSELGFKYYGRYVDDFVLVSTDKEYLKACIPKIRMYLKTNLELELHPNKIYFQNIKHGIEFLGCFFKPWCRYITPRIKTNFYMLIEKVKVIVDKEPVTKKDKEKIRQLINSYFGVLSHAHTLRLKKKAIEKLGPNFNKYFRVAYDYSKIIIR